MTVGNSEEERVMLYEVCCSSNNRDYISFHTSSIVLTYVLDRGWATVYILGVVGLATCSSTYNPARTSQEAHSVSIK
jgi:hypothetical protein